uniref:Uncharacterized protein n=1 Tax=Trypanosoma vivax (strain Y486) TaxID=1055687 RepID=G0U729_TRYVY|nr:hypothetical protein TVY486_1007320 [Trypanosoma vivax Y486]
MFTQNNVRGTNKKRYKIILTLYKINSTYNLQRPQIMADYTTAYGMLANGQRRHSISNIYPDSGGIIFAVQVKMEYINYFTPDTCVLRAQLRRLDSNTCHRLLHLIYI